jgi:hypothetical protein
MDVACGEYGDVLPGLVSGIENGRLVYQENSALEMEMQSPAPGIIIEELICQFSVLTLQRMFFRTAPIFESQMDDTKDVTVTLMGGGGSRKKEKPTYSAPFHTQVAVLLERTWRIIWRDKVYLISATLNSIFIFYRYFITLLKNRC